LGGKKGNEYEADQRKKEGGVWVYRRGEKKKLGGGGARSKNTTENGGRTSPMVAGRGEKGQLTN